MQARPKALYRLLFQKDTKLRNAMKWYTRIGKRVWFAEWYQFFFTTKITKEKITLADFWEIPEQQNETLLTLDKN